MLDFLEIFGIETLGRILAIKAPDAEKLAFKALDGPDEKVRWRAATVLDELSPKKQLPGPDGRRLDSYMPEEFEDYGSCPRGSLNPEP